MPLRPAAMAACEIPLAAASLLKLVSHASKLPVPQVAASAGAAGRLRAAPSANTRSRRREVVGATNAEIRLALGPVRRAVQNVGVNRAQNMASSQAMPQTLRHPPTPSS